MNINRDQQRGGFMMLVFFVVILLFVAVLIIKVVPVYMDNLAIQKGLETVQRELGQEPAVRNSRIKQVFLNALIPQNVANVINGQNYEELVLIERTYEGFRMTVTYQRIVPVIANASLLFDFEPSIRVP